jgi:16S rRNA (cytosine1402-N4)-methyltransferase
LNEKIRFDLDEKTASLAGPTLTGSPGRIESPMTWTGWFFPTVGPLTILLSTNEPALLPDDPAPLTPVHRSVLLREVVSWLAPGPNAIVVDGTVGAGGHASALAKLLGPEGRLIGLDRDPEMLALASTATEGLPVTLIHSSYADLGRVLDDLEIDGVDGVLLDLGLSSDQLAWSHRGFSFAEDGPLDMRYDPRTRESAADLVNELDEKELADLIFQYGEERHSRRIARRIVEARRVEPIVTTSRLAEIVRKGVPGKWGPMDPATRTFQALRISVNGELDLLDDFLAALAGYLNPGGKAAIISFHSLEDRRVKHAFRDDPELTVLTRKPVLATAEELAQNPRARSAKLRVAQRCPDPNGPTTSPETGTPRDR